MEYIRKFAQFTKRLKVTGTFCQDPYSRSRRQGLVVVGAPGRTKFSLEVGKKQGAEFQRQLTSLQNQKERLLNLRLLDEIGLARRDAQIRFLKAQVEMHAASADPNFNNTRLIGQFTKSPMVVTHEPEDNGKMISRRPAA